MGLIPKAPSLKAARGAGHHVDKALTPPYLLMAGVVVLGGTVMTLVSVHLIARLQARGVALAAAVSYGALIGPAQVGARIVEMANKGGHHPHGLLTRDGPMTVEEILTRMGPGWTEPAKRFQKPTAGRLRYKLRGRITEDRPFEELPDGRFAALPGDVPWDGRSPMGAVRNG